MPVRELTQLRQRNRVVEVEDDRGLVLRLAKPLHRPLISALICGYFDIALCDPKSPGHQATAVSVVASSCSRRTSRASARPAATSRGGRIRPVSYDQTACSLRPTA